MSIRLAIAIGSFLLGWCLGYQQGFEDGQDTLHIWPEETVFAGEWR